jgi:superfamily II DNA helicase RecQ
MTALRAWRTSRARADAIAPFIVAHDSLLLALADARPTTIAELRRIKGMGPTKLDRYGEEILAALATVPR